MQVIELLQIGQSQLSTTKTLQCETRWKHGQIQSIHTTLITEHYHRTISPTVLLLNLVKTEEPFVRMYLKVCSQLLLTVLQWIGLHKIQSKSLVSRSNMIYGELKELLASQQPNYIMKD